MPLRSQARPIGKAKLRSVEVALDRAVSKGGSHTGAARALAQGGILHRIVYLGIALAVGYGLTRLLSEPRFQISNVEIQGAQVTALIASAER